MTSHLKPLLDSVRAAAETQNWLAGLALTLTLPDICASIEYPNERHRYSKWWNDHFGDDYRFGTAPNDYVTGLEVFLLRCAYLHEGSDSADPKKAAQYQATIDKFNFVRGDAYSHLKIDGTRVLLDTSIFCEDMCLRVEKWEQTVLSEGDAAMQDRASKLLKIYVHLRGVAVLKIAAAGNLTVGKPPCSD